MHQNNPEFAPMIPTRFFVKQFLFALLLIPASVFSQTKITLGPENIIRVFGNGFTDGLFDEQVLAGDPVGGTGGNVQTESSKSVDALWYGTATGRAERANDAPVESTTSRKTINLPSS